MSEKEPTIDFNKIPINPIYGEIIFDVYIVVENNKSNVTEAFNSLDLDTKEKIRALISNMATKDNFQSPMVKYRLSNYDYGEIKPKPHRFFFFQKCGNNVIFFEYKLKKSNSLPEKVYQAINDKKERYEREFERFIKKNK